MANPITEAEAKVIVQEYIRDNFSKIIVYTDVCEKNHKEVTDVKDDVKQINDKMDGYKNAFIGFMVITIVSLIVQIYSIAVAGGKE